MAKLSSFLIDTRATADGAWIRVNEALYDDLEILTRGYTDEFVDAQAARQRKARMDLTLSENDPLPNAVARKLNASLLRDFLVLDVRNLTADDGSAVTIEEFHAMLDQPEAQRLARACWDASAKASVRTKEQADAALGN
jgi:hypothetical protein